MKQINKLLSLTLLSTFLLTACGGGGGGGGGGGSSNNDQGPASFSGKTANAAITVDNRQQLARTAVEGAAQAPKIVELEGLTAGLLPTIPDLPAFTPGNLSAIEAAIADAIATMCTGGGSASHNIDYSQVLLGKVTISLTLDDCTINGYVANGVARAVVTVGDPISSLRATFSDDFTLTGPDLNKELASAIVKCTDITDFTSCNLSQYDFVGVDGRTYRIGVVTLDGDEFIGYQIDVTKVYDPDYGAITISTAAVDGELYFGCGDELPNQGKIIFNDASTSISVTVNDCDNYSIEAI